MSPKTTEQFEAMRQRSTSTIKEVALELFAHRGYHNTSISEIARKAGVSKGLMYNYFESKEALLSAILADAVEIGEQLTEASLQSGTGAREQLRALVENTVQWMQENFHYWKLLISLSFQPGPFQEQVGPLMEGKGAAVLHRIANLFAETGAENPEEEAYFLGLVLDGLALQYMQIGQSYPLEAQKNYIIKRFML